MIPSSYHASLVSFVVSQKIFSALLRRITFVAFFFTSIVLRGSVIPKLAVVAGVILCNVIMEYFVDWKRMKHLRKRTDHLKCR